MFTEIENDINGYKIVLLKSDKQAKCLVFREELRLSKQ